MLITWWALDEPSELSKKFIVHVATTLKDLQQREDTDGDWQITIDDHGPKVRSQRPNPLWRR
jgi:alpha,alpha-trehalase